MAGEENVRRRLSVLQILQHQEEAFKKSLLWCHFVVPSPILHLHASVSAIMVQLCRDLEAIELCQRPEHVTLLDGCECGKYQTYPCHSTGCTIYRVKQAAVYKMKEVLSGSPHFLRFRTYEEGGARSGNNDRIVLSDEELYSFYHVPRPRNFIAY